MTVDHEDLEGRIAVIGMSGRFPGSRDIDAFWSNLRDGVEAVRFFSEEELLAAGERLETIRDPSYVRAAAPLEDIDQFDAAFFGMSPRDAAVFDPQHRVFLECAWQAFEHAGYVGERIDGAVGVFASCGLSEYMFKNVLKNEHVATSVGEWLIRHTGNDTNFLATRVSYEFDLHGPSLNVQTACSSTLVAVHLACQSLLSGECDVALAGGSVISPVQDHGYFYKEGEILSPDGHCRAFDARSAGTIISSAVGCVVLKPLANAIDDGDNVLAVIRGSAINNDGRAKVGFLAPSVSGQAQVVAEALAVSGVDARDVSYVEAHGTGTLIGDPIEIAGLTQAYRLSTDDDQFCAIGSLKSNIGHTGEAAGVGSLIKTVLSLQHAELPPSLHYETPNPQADFEHTPFFVNAELRPWVVEPGATRIAGITGLGAGGTNAHIVIEEAPEPVPSGPSRGVQLLTVSARSPEGVEQAAEDLAAFLRQHDDVELADVAYTRLAGRKAFGFRRAVVASSAVEAAAVLATPTTKPAGSHQHKGEAPSVVFMMPGGGAQYAGMGRQLYDDEPVYRAAVDACADYIDARAGLDVRAALFPDDDIEAASRRLERPSIALPALFATAYAMAKLLESWGIVPAAMIGHSAGEYVAACLSGVISMEDGLALVALRGRLFETVPGGAMLSVSLGEDETRALMPAGLSIAAINAGNLCVVSGPEALIIEMEAVLAARDIDGARIHIDVAAHSSMLDPILDEFGAFCRTIAFSAPTIPYVSNLTGTWVTAADVKDPDYWVRHLRNAVRFSDGIETILADPHRVLLEIGPGRTLAGLARQAEASPVAVSPTLRHPKEESSDVAFALAAVGRTWEAGVNLDPDDLFTGEQRRRLPLPTYPFERQRYWVEPDADDGRRALPTGILRKRPDVAEWFYAPSWRRSVAGPRLADPPAPARWMVIRDGASLADAVTRGLVATRDDVMTVSFGTGFRRLAPDHFEVHPGRSADWVDLVETLKAEDRLPDGIVHMTAIGHSRGRKRLGLGTDEIVAYESTVERDQASVLFLAQALSGQSDPVRLALVTSGAHALGTETELHPERTLLHGAFRVIPRELGHVATVAFDVDVPSAGSPSERVLADRLVRELASEWSTDVAVYRRGERWERVFEPLHLPPATDSPWQSGGVYLITGGLGGIGLAVAEHIAKSCHAPTLVLVGRSPLPPEATWNNLPTGVDARTRRRIAAIQQLRSIGADVVVVTADVTDADAMTLVAQRIRARRGRINGVIHSAGILHDALIALRTPTASSTVVDVKAKGALVLERVLAKDPPELLVLFSSVSSIIGLPGQVDYTAANAFLDAYAIKTNLAGDRRALVVNWNAWQEVGMAVEAARAELDKAPMVAVDPVTESIHLFDAVDDDGDVSVFSTGYSRKRQWLLAEHVVRGAEALIPGTGFLEIIRAAVEAGGPERPVELRDVFFLAPFVVGAGEVRTLKVKLDRATSSVVVFSDVEALPHVTATATAIDVGPPRHVDLAAVRARCGVRTEHFEGYSDQPFMEFGPRWGSLRSVEYGTDEALVTTIMPADYVDELNSLWLHPALLDVATGSAQALIPGFAPSGMFYVPFSYSRLVVRGPLPATAVSHVRLRSAAAHDLAVFDITIVDQDGTEVVDIEGFTMRRITSSAAFTSLRSPETGGAEPAGIESTLEAAMREGILPPEGVDALDRILDAGLTAQIVASSVDLHRWTAQVDADALTPDPDASDGAEFGGPRYERPNISSAFTPLATPIERELGSLWRELLGVERVGRDDDFFELGGQSLIAVRLFTRIKKRYSVDLPLATLFEAPTIAQCAAVVAAKLGIVDVDVDVDVDTGGPGDVDAPEAETAPTETRAVVDASAPFRSLVTIQRGGELTPFFCVHGSGGNVLNFRDLAHAMGRSQPFYALQARGIDGVLAPHTSIADMAAAYLEEIRGVQPNGPYMLGGYSGGGLVAYEMAQQLTAIGAPVTLVLLIDTFPPVIPKKHVTMKMRLDRLRHDGVGYLTYIVTRRLDARKWRREMARIDEIVARGEVVPSGLRAMNVERAFMAAAEKYVLRRWRGKVVLLRADILHVAFQALGDAYGWDEVVEDGFELIRVPGNHDNLVLEPNASTLVRKLRNTLDVAQVSHDAGAPPELVAGLG